MCVDLSRLNRYVQQERYQSCTPDIIIYDYDEQQHAAHIRQFLQCCAEKHIALNLDKCKFSQSKVTFAGFTLSAQGYQIDQSITDAISQFPTPKTKQIYSYFSA